MCGSSKDCMSIYSNTFSSKQKFKIIIIEKNTSWIMECIVCISFYMECLYNDLMLLEFIIFIFLLYFYCI